MAGTSNGADLIYSTSVDNSGLTTGLAQAKQLISAHAAEVGKMQFAAPATIPGGQFYGTNQFVPPASAMVVANRSGGGSFGTAGVGPGFAGFAAGGGAGAAQAFAGVTAAASQATQQLVTMARAMGAFAQVLNAQSGGFGAGGGGAGGGGGNPLVAAGGGPGPGTTGAPPPGVRGGFFRGFGRLATGVYALRETERLLRDNSEYERNMAFAGNDDAAKVRLMLGEREKLGSGIIGSIVGGIADPGGHGAFGVESILRDASGQNDLSKMMFSSAIQTGELVRNAAAHTTVGRSERERKEIQNRLEVGQGENAVISGVQSDAIGKRFGERRTALMAESNNAIKDMDFDRVEQIEKEITQLAQQEKDARKGVTTNLERRNKAVSDIADFDLKESQRIDAARAADANASAVVYGFQMEATNAMRVQANHPAASAREAMAARQMGEIHELDRGQKGNTAGMSGEELEGQNAKNDAARNALLARQAKEREDFERDSGQRIIAMKSEQQADELRIARQGFEAQLEELRAANERKTQEMGKAGADEDEIEQARATQRTHMTLVTTEHARAMGAFDAGVAGNVVASNLRAGGQRFAASVTAYDAATNAAVMSADAEHRPGVIAERAAGRVEMGAEHAFQVAQEKQELQARREEAAIRSDPTMPVAVRNAVAGVRGQVAANQRALNNVLPDNAAEFKKTAAAELQAQQDELNAPQSVGFAQILDPRRQVIGDPLHSLPATMRVAAMNKALDKAKADVAAQQQQTAATPGIAGVMTRITAGLMGTFGAFGAGDSSRSKDPGTKQLVDLMTQLVNIARAGNGRGALFGN